MNIHPKIDLVDWFSRVILNQCPSLNVFGFGDVSIGLLVGSIISPDVVDLVITCTASIVINFDLVKRQDSLILLSPNWLLKFNHLFRLGP